MNAISSIVIELVGSMGVPQKFAAQSAARLLPPSRHFEGSNVETNASTSVGSLTCSVRNPTQAQVFGCAKCRRRLSAKTPVGYPTQEQAGTLLVVASSRIQCIIPGEDRSRAAFSQRSHRTGGRATNRTGGFA